jgi:hypothetical protein
MPRQPRKKQYTRGKYTFVAPSRRKNKKYDVYKKKRGELVYITSFGDRNYQQYKDKIGHYKTKDHGDKKRRTSFLKRHGTAVFESANWFSQKFLW